MILILIGSIQIRNKQNAANNIIRHARKFDIIFFLGGKYIHVLGVGGRVFLLLLQFHHIMKNTFNPTPAREKKKNSKSLLQHSVSRPLNKMGE